MNRIEIPMSLSAQVADEIRKSILSGELKGGQKISVNTICRQLDVSATPVKEAFKILQAEGLLQSVPRSGTIISDFAFDNMQNMAYVRSALEGAAVYIATTIATDEELESIGKILDESDIAIKENDVDALVANNTAFHRKIREVSQTPYLVTLIEQMVSFDYTFRKRALLTIDKRILGTKEHRQILAFMKNRNAQKAEQAMIAHIRQTANTVVHEKNKL